MKTELTAVLIDDEEDGRETLKMLLEEYCPQVKVVGMADEITSGIKAIQIHKPQLVFLDIEMPGENGFELLAELPLIDFEVIFVTAYNDYAIQAFKVNAIDYLLKPVNIDELILAVDKVSKNAHLISEKGQLNELINTILTNQKGTDKIAIPISNGLKFIKGNDIIHCKSDNNYTHIYLKDGKHYLISKTIKWLEQQLASFRFYRVHASHLVNLNEIDEFINRDGGYLILSNQSNVPISQRRKEGFKIELENL